MHESSNKAGDYRPRKRELRACKICADAKVRCEVKNGDGKCKRYLYALADDACAQVAYASTDIANVYYRRRCQRLDKECIAQSHGRVSRRETKSGLYSEEDIVRLQSKVDSMSYLLSSIPTTTTTAMSPEVLQAGDPKTYIRKSPALSEYEQVAVADRQEADALFQLFRHDMSPLFPFVMLPPSMTERRLLEERPRLHMAIMAVACQSNLELQVALARAFRGEITQAILVSGEKSLELLQAILVFLAWLVVQQGDYLQLLTRTSGNSRNQTDARPDVQFSNLLHLTFALVVDLGLDSESSLSLSTPLVAIKDAPSSWVDNAPRTLEERRALLGVFWLSSVTSTCLKRMNGIKPDKYIRECCNVLQKQMQYPTDLYLTQLIHIQEAAEAIRAALYHDTHEATSGISAALSLSISSLEKDVHNLSNVLLLDIPQASTLMMSYHTIQVYLYKIALDDRLNPRTPTITSGLFPSAINHLRRADLLLRCSSGISSVIENFLSMSDTLIIALPYPMWMQLRHSIFTLWRLVTAVDHTSEFASPPNLPNYSELLERLADRVDGISSNRVGDTSPFVRRLPKMSEKFVQKLRETASEERTSPGGFVTAPHGVEGLFLDGEINDVISEFWNPRGSL